MLSLQAAWCTALPLVFICLIEELLSDQILVYSSLIFNRPHRGQENTNTFNLNGFPTEMVKGVAKILFPWRSPCSGISSLALLTNTILLSLCWSLISIRWEAHVSKPCVPAPVRLCQTKGARWRKAARRNGAETAQARIEKWFFTTTYKRLWLINWCLVFTRMLYNNSAIMCSNFKEIFCLTWGFYCREETSWSCQCL